MIKVAVLGYGVVGSGVVEVLHKNAASIAKRAKNDIAVKYILTRRDYPGDPFQQLMTQSFDTVVTDPEVLIVAECIGGVGAALTYVRESLLAGKSVVTSNKELIAKHGVELLEIARSHNVNLLFEASVGGGIPIIRPLNECLAANELSEVCGILNGTTNYILTRMIKAGLPFAEALAEAQAKGYAEADPTADVEGIDACRKICILADLSFGHHVEPELVSTEGITALSRMDVENAGKAGMKIKLLGRAIMNAGGKLTIYVAPHLIPEDYQLANVEDVFNAIVVKGDAIGDVMFYGKGAGKLPTASAVVADIIDASKHTVRRKYLEWTAAPAGYLADCGELQSQWYVRGSGCPIPEGAEILSQKDGEISFITGVMSKYALDEALGGSAPHVALRVLE